jgi:hypothetical protein
MNRLPFAEWLKKYGISPLHAAFPDVGGYDYARMWADGVEPVDARQDATIHVWRMGNASIPNASSNTQQRLGEIRNLISTREALGPRYIFPDAYRTR